MRLDDLENDAEALVRLLAEYEQHLATGQPTDSILAAVEKLGPDAVEWFGKTIRTLKTLAWFKPPALQIPDQRMQIDLGTDGFRDDITPTRIGRFEVRRQPFQGVAFFAFRAFSKRCVDT